MYECYLRIQNRENFKYIFIVSYRKKPWQNAQEMNQSGYLISLTGEMRWRTWVRARLFTVHCIFIEFYVSKLCECIVYSKCCIFKKNFINPTSISSSSAVTKILWEAFCDPRKGHGQRTDHGPCPLRVYAPPGEDETCTGAPP